MNGLDTSPAEQRGAPATLVTLVRESLSLWGVDAQVVADVETSCLLRIDGPDALSLSIVAADSSEEPIRWWLCWHARDEGTCRSAGAGSAPLLQRKPCASTLGLLRTLRESLGIPAGPRVRIGLGAAPGPSR